MALAPTSSTTPSTSQPVGQAKKISVWTKCQKNQKNFDAVEGKTLKVFASEISNFYQIQSFIMAVGNPPKFYNFSGLVVAEDATTIPENPDSDSYEWAHRAIVLTGRQHDNVHVIKWPRNS